MENSNWDRGFWNGVLREEDGTPSFSRSGSLLLLLGVLGWVTHVVLKTHVIPDLTGVSYFLVGGVSALYGVNKGATTIKAAFDKFSGNNNNNNMTPQA